MPGQDPERFFPLGVTGLASDQIRQAKAVCAGCEVRDECLHWALDTNQDAGIWGGLSEDERRVLRRTCRRSRPAGIVRILVLRAPDDN